VPFYGLRKRKTKLWRRIRVRVKIIERVDEAHSALLRTLVRSTRRTNEMKIMNQNLLVLNSCVCVSALLSESAVKIP